MTIASVTKLSPATIKSSIVAAVGGLLFGFDTAVIAGTTKDLSQLLVINIPLCE
jgi:hypothetical protein